MTNTELFTKDEKELLIGILGQQTVKVTHPEAVKFVTQIHGILSKLDGLTAKQEEEEITRDGEQSSAASN